MFFTRPSLRRLLLQWINGCLAGELAPPSAHLHEPTLYLITDVHVKSICSHFLLQIFSKSVPCLGRTLATDWGTEVRGWLFLLGGFKSDALQLSKDISEQAKAEKLYLCVDGFILKCATN